MLRLDEDHNELLTLPEFNAGARNREVKASDLFQSVDADGDGFWEASILFRMAPCSQMDLWSSASKGRVSRSEFLKASQGPTELRSMNQAFRRADSDKDGSFVMTLALPDSSIQLSWLETGK